ncbi:MAG TPA: hypothetical protein P5572_04255 [Phycisphaerae bacterium]|nr:hypothetical protein [Phycisphaerae bacterium]
MERLNRRGNGWNARVRRLRWVVSCGSALLAATVFAGEVEKKPLPLVDNALLPPLFKQGEAARRDGSKMVFFLGNFDDNLTHKRPVLVYVEGSGAQSQFVRMGDRIGYSVFGLIAQHAGDRYHVATTEKRGVAFGDPGRRGIAEGASAEYNAHATLAERVADVRLLLDVLLAAPQVDPRKVLVVGHSEGADVAAAAAAEDDRITHVAFLSGGGAAQFFDFFVMCRKQMAAEGASAEDVEKAIGQIEADMRAVLADPESTTRFYQGHAFRRWSTFAMTASADNLLRTRAKLFLAHGTADTSVPIESFDSLIVELLRHGRTDFTERRCVDCDHSFIKRGDDPSNAPFLKMLDEVLAWAGQGV